MLSLKQVAALYLQEVAITKSRYTLMSYRALIDSLVKYLGNVAIDTISKDDFMAFVAMKSEYCNRNTVRSYIIRGKVFFSWCTNAGYIENNILLRVPLPKVLPRSDNERAISADDLERLLRYAYNKNARDFAFIMLLASSGARMGAVTRLRLDGLHLERGYAEVIEKGGIATEISFNAETAFALQRYLDIRPVPNPQHDFVWCKLHQVGHQAMSYGGMNALLKRYSKAAGCSRLVSGHEFRHKVGQDWSKRPDVSPVDTQNKLNHANFETTWRYYYARNSGRVRELTDDYNILPEDIRQNLYMLDLPDNIIQFPEE